MTDRSLKALVAAPFFALVVALPAFAGDNPDKPTQISDPASYRNLSIYFIRGPSDPGPVPLTLDEALEKGRVKVHETQTVSELEIENTGEEAVLVHAGDIVKGGQQDRVLTVTILVPPKSGRLPIASYCVERGRWSARGNEEVATFASSKSFMPSLEGKRAMRIAQKAEAERLAAADSATTAAVPPEGGPAEAGAEYRTMGEPVARSGLGGRDAQGEVWRNVDTVTSSLVASLDASVAADASPTSLQLALENEKLAKAQAEYVDALKPRGEVDADVIGLVIAVNGEVKSADVYPSNALFRKFWSKHVNAAATEAIARRDDTAAAATPAREPAKADVEAFLADAKSGQRHDQPLSASLDLEVSDGKQVESFASRMKDGQLLHLNVLRK